MATLNTTIAIFAGHDMPREFQPVQGICTVGEFYEANADAMDGEALQQMLDDLDERGVHRIGGGAEAAFIALRMTPVEPAFSRLMGKPSKAALH